MCLEAAEAAGDKALAFVVERHAAHGVLVRRFDALHLHHLPVEHLLRTHEYSA